ncbi:serine hydrolase domain-containing protein [Paraglaciecola aestuariivivens]
MEIKRFNRYALFVFCVMSVVGCNSNDNKTIETGVRITLQETMDSALEANIGINEPGLTLSVWQDGVELYSNSRGIARPDQAIDENTQFRLASVSKTFTALAIMKLYERGSVNLHDSVLYYLPQLDESWRPITLHHLLSHRSGIPDYNNDFDISEILPNGITAKNIIDYFIQNPELEFEPDSQGDYSNTGFVLLAEIVSVASGLSFSEFMHIEFFQQLGMTESFIWNEEVNPTTQTAMNFAQNHQIFGREFYGVGSSSQVSSLENMTKFVLALMNGQIIQPETLTLMLEIHSELLGEIDLKAGYGVLFFNNANTALFGHTGSNDSFRTIYVVNRSTNAFIVILGNGGDSLPDYNYLINLVGEFVN